MSEAAAPTSTKPISELFATVVRACGRCSAPGFFRHEPRLLERQTSFPMTWPANPRERGWPGCYVEADDPRCDQPVGAVCPNCGASRPADEPKGKIWERFER